MLPIVERRSLELLQFYMPGNPYLDSGDIQVVVSLIYNMSANVVIEFGCNTGRTAKAVLDNVASIKRYIGIDVPSDHTASLKCQQKEVPARAGVYCDDRRFQLMLGDSYYLKTTDLPPCDAAFIDGDHSRVGVLHDSMLAHDRVRQGGIVIWHDYGNDSVEVTEVLDDLHDKGWPIVQLENSWLAFMRR
jgi:predicted O-methyltransferase YrrM